MAFPTIPTVAAGRVLFTLNTAGGATKTFPNLSSLTKAAGDLLIAIIVEYDGNSTDAEFSDWGGGFTEFGDRAGTATMAIGAAYKWSTGSETGTFTVTTADTSTNDSVMILLAIPGAHATTPPEMGVMTTSVAAPPAVGTALDPTGWATEETLWIAIGGSGETNTGGSYTGITAAPTNYVDYAESGITADAVGGVEAAVAFRQLSAASEAPGAWTGDTSNARGAASVIAIRPATVLNNYSLDCQPGSFAVSGFAATIPAGRALSADPGSYASAGLATTLARGREMALDPGVYAVSGLAAGVLSTRELGASPGAYAVTGVAAELLPGFPLSADPGSYAVTGFAAALLVGRALSADPGAYAVAGDDAALLAGFLASLDPGDYAITGASADLGLGRVLSADPGAYAITGSAADLISARVLSLDPGAYNVAGADTALLAGLALSLDPGAYLVTGAAADLTYASAGAYVLSADAGSYAVAGASATLAAGYLFVADAGVYAITGAGAGALVGRLLTAVPGSYAIAGVAADLDFAGSGAFILSADPGLYVVAGGSATLVGPVVAVPIGVVVGTDRALAAAVGEARAAAAAGRIRPQAEVGGSS